MKTINQMIMDKEIMARGNKIYSKVFNEPNAVKRDIDILNFLSDNELEQIKMVKCDINKDCRIVYFKSL